MIKVIFLAFIIIIINLIDIFEITALMRTEVFNTTKGPLRGVILETVINRMKYSAFKGIPYAKPPIGRRRFQPPEEIEPWDGILNTTNSSLPCPQWNFEKNYFDGNESCLHLNVYTPKMFAEDTKLRSVMVWIYGGAFRTGSVNATRYGPDFMLEEDIVLVAMSYRLGALGFLSLNHVNATGNMALKDQLLALKWVRRNIKNFGGDPDQVTIFGQSAGSVAVQLHKLSPLSRGLFSRSIAMSGSPLNVWAVSVKEQAVLRAFYLAKQLGIKSSDASEVLEELYKIPVEKIIETTANLEILDLTFKPTIEDPEVATDPFISDCIVTLYINGNFSQEPHMLGFTHSETVAFASSFASFIQTINSALETVVGVTGISTVADVLNLQGLLNTSLTSFSDLTYDVIYDAIRITTDLLFVGGIDRAQQYLSQGDGPVYYYRNSYDYPRALHKIEYDGINHLNGTGHTDDIAHIFWVQHENQSTEPNRGITGHRSIMVKLWTNMAKYGNPTPNGTADPELNFTWPDSGPEGLHLEIDTNYTIEPRPIDDLINFLRNLAVPIQLLFGSCPSSL